jgi:ATP-binding cassette, subfamily B, bacterial
VSEPVVEPASTLRRITLLWRVIRQADRKLAGLILGTLVLSALAGPLQSLALKLIVDTAVDQRWTTAILAAVLGGFGAGLLGSAERAMSDTEHVVTNQVGLRIDHNSLELASSMPGVEHLERPEYLDQLALVRSGGRSLMRAVFTLTRTASLGISLLASLWLLAAVHPLLLLTPLCAIPTAVLVPRSERYVDRARTAAAERRRAAVQLHKLFLTPGPAMELRVFDAADRADSRADQLWREVSDIELRGAVRSALLASVGWLTLTAGYLGAVLLTAKLAIDGRATIGDIILVSQLALQVRGNVARTADAARKAAAALRTADRFIWLQDLYTEQVAAYPGKAPVPDLLVDGIRLRAVSFTYPGTEVAILNRLDLDLPAGSTVAVVGENGAGKTTLVKLLTGMYRPTSGSITVDGTNLADLDITTWRRKLSGAFQDFLRLETIARTTVGIGDPQALDDTDRINRSVNRGGARPVIDQLSEGLDGHVGKTYADGAELSGGQWQRLAVARSHMPEAPLCVILDEPTAALDPEAEQRIFDSYSRPPGDADNAHDNGAVTVLITHRFSSVRMADIIVVLHDGEIAEQGTHAQLLAADGRYAHMYRQQAAAYR